MKKLLFSLVLAATFLLPVPVEAGLLYGVRETGDILISIDTDTLDITEIGPLNVTFQFGGLAWDSSSSTLYMIDGRGAQSLYTVDTGSGNATLVGRHGVSDLFGLTYDSKNDDLYGATFTGGLRLYTMDRGDGSGNPGPALPHRVGGLAYNSRDDMLVGVEDGAGDLWEIDRNTGDMNLLFAGDFTNDSGLAYDSEKHLLWDLDWSGNLYSYDIANGYARTTHKTGLGPHDGLAFVPEPTSLLLIGLGALAAFRRRS